MVCKNCGQELDDKATVCSQCGSLIDEDLKIQITYEDEQVDYVDPPVITEAHTFIDEESFAKKLNSAKNNKKQDEEEFWDDSSSSKPFIWVLVTLLFVVVGLVGYFVVYPNVVEKQKKNTQEVGFTSEDWKSGEFIIDGDFYRLKKDFSIFYNNHWNFVDEDTVDFSLDPKEETEELAITNSFNKESIRIRLRNPNNKETKVKNSIVWSVQLDNSDDEHTLNFELPGKIQNGSKELEILSLYGSLTEDNIIRDDESHSTTYHYSQDKKNLDLVVDDDKGLIAFHYYFS